MDAHFWDERYETQDQLWSGEANGVLVTEVAELPAGQALDVGCGEGADASWLAARGWQVTAVDISRVALQRAAARATDTDAVAWMRADLATTTLPAGAFDLVSVQYYPLPRRRGHSGVHNLLSAVAPGGTLLVASHDLADMTRHDGHEHDDDHDVDPADYYQPHEIAELLDEDWTVLADETRPRTAPPPPGTNHVHDTVLRARRLPSSSRTA